MCRVKISGLSLNVFHNIRYCRTHFSDIDFTVLVVVVRFHKTWFQLNQHRIGYRLNTWKSKKYTLKSNLLFSVQCTRLYKFNTIHINSQLLHVQKFRPTSGLISVTLALATNSLKNPSSSVPSMYPFPVELENYTFLYWIFVNFLTPRASLTSSMPYTFNQNNLICNLKLFSFIWVVRMRYSERNM